MNLAKKVAEVNELIEKAKEDYVMGVETDSTWESVYEFLSITLMKTKLVVKYKKDYTEVVVDEVRFAHDCDLQDTKYMLSWVKKCIKKGYRQQQ